MNLVNYEPFRAMNRLQEEINQLLGSTNWPSAKLDESHVATSSWMPSVDIKEESKRFLIRADVPGVDPKDIEVSMQDGVLTVKGERKSEQVTDGDEYRRVECSYGSFYRRFGLPDTADSSKIKAKGKDGVLEIEVAKKAPAKAKRIKISS